MKVPKRIRCVGGSRGSIFIDITNEWLEYHLKLKKTAQQIGDIVGAEASTVNKWIQDRELRPDKPNSDGSPRKVIQGKRIRWVGITQEWLYQQHITSNKSSLEMAKGIGCSQQAICRWLARYGIKKSQEQLSKNHLGSGNPCWRGGKIGYQKRSLLQTGEPIVCGLCGTTEDIQIHHVDHNRQNGNLENLTWLCGYCNRLESNLWALCQKGRATFTYGHKKLEVSFL